MPHLHADALDDLISQTQSADGGQRADAFSGILPYLTRSSVDPRVVPALINLLTLEYDNPTTAGFDGDYYFQLIATVANLNDPRTIPVLVQNVGTGNLVPQALSSFGSAALDPVLERQNDPDWVVRKCVMVTLINMIDPSNPSRVNDPVGLQKVTAAFQQGSIDQSPYVSSTALTGLQKLGASTPVSIPSSQISVVASGLAYSRVSGTFNGTVTVTNVSNGPLTGPFQLVLSSLTSGVTLANGTGLFNGSAFLTIPGASSLAAGQSVVMAVRFKNSSTSAIHFTPMIYAGTMN